MANPQVVLALPEDTTIDELAKVFDVSTAKLTPAAAKLTKGELMQLNGAKNDMASLRQYAASGAPPLAVGEKNAKVAKLALTVEDLHSIQAVFGTPRIPGEFLRRNVAVTATGARLGTELPPIHIYACCCPCCCATAVTSPNRMGVA